MVSVIIKYKKDISNGMALAELIMLIFDWFMLSIIMLLSIKSISVTIPFVKKTVVAQTLWYLFIALGYSLICVTIFTSWVIWFIGGFWAMVTLFLTWFILFFVFLSYQKLVEVVSSKKIAAESGMLK